MHSIVAIDGRMARSPTHRTGDNRATVIVRLGADLDLVAGDFIIDSSSVRVSSFGTRGTIVHSIIASD